MCSEQREKAVFVGDVGVVSYCIAVGWCFLRVVRRACLAGGVAECGTLDDMGSKG